MKASFSASSRSLIISCSVVESEGDGDPTDEVEVFTIEEDTFDGTYTVDAWELQQYLSHGKH
jgi:hypothetical protein